MTQEITLNEDGSGTISNTNDMSTLIGMAKQMGGADMEGANQVVDSTISMNAGADSIPNLTAEEKEMVKKGTLRINMDMKNEKFLTKLSFPFTSPAEVAVYNKLSGKIMSETLKEQMGEGMPMGGEMPEPSSFDDYYNINFSNGLLTKTLDKEKFARAADDEYLKSMKETAAMGLSMKANYVINLPRPAKMVEGKGIRLSEDKKTITISSDLDDFFDVPPTGQNRVLRQQRINYFIKDTVSKGMQAGACRLVMV